MLYNEYVEDADDTSEDAVENVFPFRFSFGLFIKRMRNQGNTKT